jgi:plastocyanin
LCLFAFAFLVFGTRSALSWPDRLKTAEKITNMFTRVPFRRLVTPLLVAGALAVVHIPDVRAARAHGRITGVVHLVALAGTPLRSGAYPSRRINPQTPDAAEIENVIVFVKDAPTEPDLTMTRASISQRDESFVPRVVAITRGSSVEFPNFDPYFHNVFSLSRAQTFDLGRFRKGEKRDRVFPRSGVVKVYCHIHSEMAATILIFDHRLYATPATSGSFVIDAVPPGTYQLSAWHERIGETTKPIKVVAGEDASVEFSLPVVEK